MNFRDAVRSQESLLAPLERKCLVWLARRTPSRIQPDHLTALGLAAMMAAGMLYAGARWWPPCLALVDVCLALNWFGDSLDGTLARERRRLRPRYGFYVDHMVDSVSALFLLGGLALSGYMTERVALALLLGYLLLSIDAYLATYTIGTFHLSAWMFSPTEMRILLAIGNLVALARPTVSLFGARWLFFDVGGVVAVASMTVVLVSSIGRNVRTLYRAERIVCPGRS